MAVNISMQLGREDIRFTPMPGPEHIDRFYDVRDSYKPLGVPAFEKAASKPYVRVDEGCSLDYNPTYDVVKPTPIVFSISNSSRRDCHVDRPEEVARHNQEKRKQYRQLQERLRDEEERAKENALLKAKPASGYSNTVGRDAPVTWHIPKLGIIGTELTEAEPLEKLWSQVTTRPTGGKFARSGQRTIVAFPHAEAHTTCPSYELPTMTDMLQKKPAVNMRKTSGRHADPTTGSVYMPTEHNRIQLNEILKKVERMNAAREAERPSTIPFKTGQKKKLIPDLYLSGGREMPCNGAMPSETELLRAVAADVECQSQRVHNDVHLMQRRQAEEQRRATNRRRHPQGSPLLSGDTRLQRQLKAFQERESLAHLQEEMSELDFGLRNAGGSLHRARLRGAMREAQREEGAQHAQRRVTDFVGGGDDLDEF